jgi:poly(3-hydroxyalkanoate) synthetase
VKLRTNDLIWSNVVNKYLLGKGPPAFDLLYWNADGTRMARAAHSFYLRTTCLENNLVKTKKVNLKVRSGKQAAPPSMGSEAHPPITSVPGTYVLEK